MKGRQAVHESEGCDNASICSKSEKDGSRPWNVVRNRDRKKRRDDKEEQEKGQPGSRLQVVKTLIGSLGSSQNDSGGRVGKVDMRLTKLVKSTKTPVLTGDIKGDIILERLAQLS